MMGLHIWDDDNPPTVHLDSDDEYIKLLDFPHWVGYQVGDQVQYVTGTGTEVYIVIEVEKEYAQHNDYDGRPYANVVLLEQQK